MQGRQDFPILKDIQFVFNNISKRFQINGDIYNDARWGDGTNVTTSDVVNIDIENKTLRTKNTLYRIGDLED